LGKIGGDMAAKALTQALSEAPANARSAVAEGCIRCAELYLADGNHAAATRLYDLVRQSKAPKQRVLEATRGAILARQSAGIPLLIEQLRSDDKALFSMGLRTARELVGREVTEALAVELDRIQSSRQPALLLALADRKDAAVLPKVLQVAGNGSENMRIVAVGILEQLGDPSAVPVLLEAAIHSNAKLAQTAKAALARLESKKVDADVMSRLPQSAGKMRLVLIELAGQRRIDDALPLMMSSLKDPDAETRRAALETIGAIGTEKQVADLVRMLPQASTSQDRASMEKTLMSLCGRWGTPCASLLLPLAQHTDSAMRMIALRAMASIGGPDALSTIVKAVKDPDGATQDEAVGLLATWPGNWPEDVAVADPLLALAKSSGKNLHQVQGVRGYLQFLQENKKLKEQEKLAQFKELLPFIKRPDEKRLAIATASAFSATGALAVLTDFAADSDVSEEACLAIVNLAAGNKLKDVPKEQRTQALQKVLETARNDATRKKADTALKSIK
jgi:HEAT repeat protein